MVKSAVKEEKAMTPEQKEPEWGFFVVGLCGKKGVGKDTVANFLSAWYDAVHIKLAAPLKGMLFLRDANAFNHVSPYTRFWLQELGDFVLLQDQTTFARLASYQILQRLVKDIEMYEQYGVTPLTPPIFVISDIRYPHEVEFLRERFGNHFHLIKIERKVAEDDLSKHKSETSVDQITPDFVINNDGNFAQLFMQVNSVMEKILGDITFYIVGNMPRLYLSRNVSAQNDEEVKSMVRQVVTEFKRYKWWVYDPYRPMSAYLDDVAELGLPEAAKHVVWQDMSELSRCNAVLCLLTQPSIGCAIEVWAAVNMGKPVVVCTKDLTIWSHPFLQSYVKVKCDIAEAIDYLLTVTGSRVMKEIFGIYGGVKDE